MINFYGNESEPQECSKVIAVEHDCLQLIDVKKKEIRKLKISASTKLESQPKQDTKIVDNGIIVDNTREWLFKLSLAKSTGQTCCTVVRDCQLRKFDYMLKEFDQTINEDLQQKPTTITAASQLTIINTKIDQLTPILKQLEKE